MQNANKNRSAHSITVLSSVAYCFHTHTTRTRTHPQAVDYMKCTIHESLLPTIAQTQLNAVEMSKDVAVLAVDVSKDAAGMAVNVSKIAAGLAVNVSKRAAEVDLVAWHCIARVCVCACVGNDVHEYE